jgi:hypothetical protein
MGYDYPRYLVLTRPLQEQVTGTRRTQPSCVHPAVSCGMLMATIIQGIKQHVRYPRTLLPRSAIFRPPD